jgi:hypothetical protein
MSRSRLLSAPRSFVFSAGDTRPASGITLGFKPVTGNERESDCIGETNFFMDITDIRERQLKITFYNRAPVPCTISDIYFSDGDLFSISVQSARGPGEVRTPACSIEAWSGDHLSAPEPYHDSSNYQAAKRSTDDPEALQDGIKPNESLGIIFDLQAGITLADVIGALNKGHLNISMRLVGDARGAGGLLINESRLGLGPGW